MQAISASMATAVIHHPPRHHCSCLSTPRNAIPIGSSPLHDFVAGIVAAVYIGSADTVDVTATIVPLTAAST